jgi:hypothetical protein
MGVSRPYRRTVRPFADGEYSEGGRWMYVEHSAYAKDAEHYIRAFGIIHKDLIELFDYIEPADANLMCYSYRIHELLTRACIEIEANLKAILVENGYSKSGNWTMEDYRKVERSHRLSSYKVKLPTWQGTTHTRLPFADWKAGGGLRWYQDYNAAKHDRHGDFVRANFSALLDAVTGLVALRCAQFFNAGASPGGYLILNGPNDGFDETLDDYYRVALPRDWPAAERYDFDWQSIKDEADPFQSYAFA